MSHENFNAIPHRIENLTKQIDDEIAEKERDALSDDKSKPVRINTIKKPRRKT
jgi:hypothetical protein